MAVIAETGARFRRRAGLACLAIVLGLSGCGERDETPLTLLARNLLDRVQGGDDPAAPPVSTAAMRAQLTPELFAAVGGELLLAEFVRRPGASALVPVGRGNDTRAWRGADGSEVTLLGSGLLVATRGLGADLMSADVSETQAALRARRPGPVMRMHVYLDGDLQSVQTFIDCDLSFDGNRAVERCELDGDVFENVYVLSPGGGMVRSLQWVGPEHGLVALEIARP